MHLKYGGYDVNEAAESLKTYCYGTVHSERFPRVGNTIEEALKMLGKVNWVEIAETNIKRCALADKRFLAYNEKARKRLAKRAMC